MILGFLSPVLREIVIDLDLVGAIETKKEMDNTIYQNEYSETAGRFFLRSFVFSQHNFKKLRFAPDLGSRKNLLRIFKPYF